MHANQALDGCRPLSPVMPPKGPKPLDESIAEVFESVEYLEKAMAEMAAKLQPVLVCEPPAACVAGCTLATPSVAPCTERLEILKGKIEATVSHLHSIRSRLAL